MSASSAPPSSRRWLIYGSVALVLALGVWYAASRSPAPSTGGRNRWNVKAGSQAVPVRAEVARQEAFAVYLKSIGTVTPLNTVTVRSRVDGPLQRIAFAEGQRVGRGDLLAEIDSAPYRIRLAQTEGQLQQNAAQLQTARSDLQRFEQLFAQNLVTRQELELQQALVASREGALAASKAQVETARLELSYTRIEAPIAGRLGLRQVDTGNLVRAGDANGLVVITQTAPISVLFTVPETDLQQVLDGLRTGDALVVEAWDRNERSLLATGTLRTVDNQINVATGTLRLRAEFANADDRLFPNQFVNVRLRVVTLPDAIVVPTSAVQFGSRGTYVYVVNERNEAKVRDVVLGPANALLQTVTSGVKAGEPVVVEGIDRLRDGRAVTLIGESAPAAPAAEPAAKSGPGGRPGSKGR
jgi:multidrug efflux system membrane fusion protein